MKKLNTLPAICAGFVISATVASAARQNLPIPPKGQSPDTESSAVVSLSEWPNLGTHLQLRLTANVTPTNNVQVAFGTDVNRNADLEPEETDFVAGIDCGVAFVRDERSDLPPSASFLNLGSCTFDLTSAYRSYAPNLAKVTTRGLPDANATIKAKVFNTGLMLIVR